MDLFFFSLPSTITVGRNLCFLFCLLACKMHAVLQDSPLSKVFWRIWLFIFIYFSSFPSLKQHDGFQTGSSLILCIVALSLLLLLLLLLLAAFNHAYI